MESASVCIISPPEFDVTTAALYQAWIAGQPPGRLLSIAKEYYDKGAQPGNTNYAHGLVTEDEDLDLEGAENEYANEEENGEQEELQGTPTSSDRRKYSTVSLDEQAAEREAAAEAQSPARHQLVFRRSRRKGGNEDEIGEMIKSAVFDEIRTFEALEHFLLAPTLLRSQTMIQIRSVKMQAFVIEKYWSLDDTVVKELIVGSKRLSRSRKDLDDVAESTGIPLRSVTRQFDNLKRCYTQIEDLEDCNLFEYMSSNILLPTELARKYACILFLLYSKFNLTSKRRIQRVKLRELEKCAAVTLACLVSDSDTFFRICKQGFYLVEDKKLTFRARGDPPPPPPLPLPLPPAVTASTTSAASTSSLPMRSSMPPSPAQAQSSAHTFTASSDDAANEKDEGGDDGCGEAPGDAGDEAAAAGAEAGGSGQAPRQVHSSSVASSFAGSYSPVERPPPPLSLQSPPPPASQSSPKSPLSQPGPGLLVQEVSDDVICEALAGSSDSTSSLWSLVWSVLECVGAMDPDKQLMNNLRDIKTVVTGDVLNAACQIVSSSLLERNPRGGPAILKKLDASRLRSALKTVMQIGANLSQSREYRDFFEDVLTKVVEPLEEFGLSLSEIVAFLSSCSTLVKAIPSLHRISNLTTSSGKRERLDLKRDWSRFLLCCRFVVEELFSSRP